MKIGYLGPKGSFSEEALQKFISTTDIEFHSPTEIVPYPSIPKLLLACQSSEIDSAFVPLENSIEGQIGVTLDMLAQTEGLYIMREFLHQVEQCLLAAKNIPLNQIEQVYSHEQALGQCREFLELNLSQADQFSCSSTAEAAYIVSHNPQENWAAIGPRRSAEIYGLSCLAERIQDSTENTTRFIFVGHNLAELNEDDKTSLLIITGDTPGALFNVLQEFASRQINLSRIESRPSKKRLGEYVFFVDIDGYVFSSDIQDALWALKNKNVYTKLLGSYPKATLIIKDKNSPKYKEHVDKKEQNKSSED
ncbi:MAG: prephenate dehydratase [Desulfitobacterium sp.]|nr:prephenate dehydratase [Desulfitobacterium sp.]